ncbi:MAG: hypothetical protein OXB98_11820 [Bryobacterales bacterium]|nr:hypothetical protein [Bryobacterales bacterium]
MYLSSEQGSGENGSDHNDVLYRRTARDHLPGLSGRIEDNAGSR